MPSVPAGKAAVVMAIVVAMSRVKPFEPCCPPASVTCTVTLYVPALKGVPEMVPVVVPKPTPAGNMPEAIDQV